MLVGLGRRWGVGGSIGGGELRAAWLLKNQSGLKTWGYGLFCCLIVYHNA